MCWRRTLPLTDIQRVARRTSQSNAGLKPWQRKLHDIIFEAESPAGMAFDAALLVAILASVVAVMLESVESIDAQYHKQLLIAEWFFTILFTIEYVLRLLCVVRPSRYALSFLGIVDLLSIVPTYLSLLLPGSQGLAVIRGLRLLRVFRIFKLAHFFSEAQVLKEALLASRAKITVFLATVAIAVTIMGSLMHLIEGRENGFDDIPTGIYWAIVTMTTVGFGDITPHTTVGKTVASMMMVFGYSLIIIPTGIISGEMARGTKPNSEACPHCMKYGHDINAKFCDRCGEAL